MTGFVRMTNVGVFGLVGSVQCPVFRPILHIPVDGRHSVYLWKSELVDLIVVDMLFDKPNERFYETLNIASQNTLFLQKVLALAELGPGYHLVVTTTQHPKTSTTNCAVNRMLALHYLISCDNSVVVRSFQTVIDLSLKIMLSSVAETGLDSSSFSNFDKNYRQQKVPLELPQRLPVCKQLHWISTTHS